MTPSTTWSEIKATIGMQSLAERLNLKRQAVYKWEWSDKGIPAERVPEVERITGIKRESLRPDLWEAR